MTAAELLKNRIVCLLVLFSIGFIPGWGHSDAAESPFAHLDLKIRELMREGDIPGMSLVIVQGNEPPRIRSYGQADPESGTAVTPDTLFELGSLSKAFTALAALKLAQEGRIDLDDPVSEYLPWFYAVYEAMEYDITLRQFLHQTSGIPWRTIDLIPPGDRPDALEHAVRRMSGIELAHPPGSRFLYATANYDIIGLVIEKVTGIPYETYMEREIFSPLGLDHTAAGTAVRDTPLMARGSKIAFGKPRLYKAPSFRGNTPAGYIVSSGRDIARWLRMQMGLVPTPFYPLMRQSQSRNENVPPDPRDFSSYAMGWFVYIDGSGDIGHGGLNPNFTSYIGFNPGDKIGVALLANSDSAYTAAVGRWVMGYLRDPDVKFVPVTGSGLDKAASLFFYVLCLYLLLVLLFMVSIGVDLVKGRRRFEGIDLLKVGKWFAAVVVLTPFLLGIYLIPHALSNISWDTAVVWSPFSFRSAVLLLVIALGLSYAGFFFSSLFPQRNRYLRSMPMILILSLLSGGANAVVIFLITSALFSHMQLAYQLYYFALAFFVYIIGRKVIQTRLVRIANSIVYDLRMRLVQKLFLTSFQRFEKLDRGRVFATLNNDTGQIGGSANVLVQLITSAVTALGAFIYLATIAFWATMVTLAVVVTIATLYAVVSQKSRRYFEDARDTQNVYLGLLNGLLDGFKELSLHVNKKRAYSHDVERSCAEFRDKVSVAFIKFINAFLVGESLLIIVLGAVGFGIPRIFPDIGLFTLMSFIMILLYLIGPVNGILNSIPNLVQIRVAWKRVKGFEKDIPANMASDILEIEQPRTATAASIEAKGVEFEYEADSEEEKFKVGPVDFYARQGEITFIIGGNGSGKTTLARLLTGLYPPHRGEIKVNGSRRERGDGRPLGEYFSTVFSDYHLFEKLYDVDLEGREGQLREYLSMLRLQDKVNIKNNAFSTIDLSGGQRKRLALLQCYLEDSPIYLFDEIAADQDPEFRRFFYRDLLLRMKKEGKIVIAITHDDHYFDVADKVIKMELGKIEFQERGGSYRR